jgi:4-amino-4-deoxy-L-arabinose transferase-like glycosyltransferase
VVFGLLVLIAAELFLSTRQESQVFDESAHLFAGFEYWKHGDFGRNPEHPPLVKLIAAAPLLPLDLKEPGPVPIPYFKAQDFINASQFLYGVNTGATTDWLLTRGRIMIGLFSVALAIVVLAAAREMFGREAALLALVLLAFEPVLLANGAIITTDVPLACLFFLSVYTFYRYVKRPSLTRLALCSVATGLTLVAKHSGIVILPTLLVLAIAEVVSRPRTPDDVSTGSSVRSRAGMLAAALVAIALSSYLLLWAFYGFRYGARPPGMQMMPSLQAYAMALPNSAEKALIGLFAKHHLLPEAYLYGWVDILIIPGTRPTFVFGKIYGAGQWFFFPAMILIKSTITLLALLALVPFVGLWKRRRRELLFMAIPAAVFLLISILSGLNLGVRHVLPI